MEKTKKKAPPSQSNGRYKKSFRSFGPVFKSQNAKILFIDYPTITILITVEMRSRGRPYKAVHISRSTLLRATNSVLKKLRKPTLHLSHIDYHLAKLCKAGLLEIWQACPGRIYGSRTLQTYEVFFSTREGRKHVDKWIDHFGQLDFDIVKKTFEDRTPCTKVVYDKLFFDDVKKIL